MNSLEALSDYFVFFNDKVFAEIAEIPAETRAKWHDFRYLLKKKPLDLDKINVFVKQMYDIPVETLTFALKVPEIPVERKKSAYLLKKKSTITNNFNVFQAETEKIEKISERFGDSRVTSLTSKEIHEFLPTNRRKYQGYLFENQGLLEEIRDFREILKENTAVLEKNLRNSPNQLEIQQFASSSREKVEENLKNISVYFMEKCENLNLLSFT